MKTRRVKSVLISFLFALFTLLMLLTPATLFALEPTPASFID